MAAVYYSVVGLERLVRRLASAELSTEPAMVKLIKDFADGIMEDSKAKYVPVGPTTGAVKRFRSHGFNVRLDRHSGALRDSGKVEEPEVSGRDVSVRLSYGGGGVAAPYAIAVHEHLSKFSPPSWLKAASVTFNQGGPKYLERPVMEHSRHLASKLSAIVSIILR